MQLRRVIAALAAAALTAGVTYGYAKPLHDRNQIAFWRTADGTQVNAYNTYGQPVATYHVPASNQPPNVIVRNTYDRQGNRLRACRTLADGAVDLELRWTYDRDGRMLSQTQIQGQDQSVTTYTYALDAQGRVVQIEETYEGQPLNTICKTYRDTPGGGWCETAVREGMGILDTGDAVDPRSLLTPDEACMRFGRSETVYDAHGAVQKITVWGDFGTRTWVYTYNDRGQPTEIVEQLDGQPVGREAIDYDADGLTSQINRYHASGQEQIVFHDTDPILI